MNYNSEVYEDNLINFFKQLFGNIVKAACAVLAIALILVYCFKYEGYIVWSDSMTPVYYKNDLVFVKGTKDVEVGDIIKYDLHDGSFPVTHRLIAIETIEGTTYYLCHGDAVQDANSSYDHLGEYQDDIDYVNGLNLSSKTLADAKSLTFAVDYVKEDQIEGKVVGHIYQAGKISNFIQEQPVLLIGIVVAIWCVSETFAYEKELRQAQRLLK